MPEGHTLHRLAADLDAAFAGHRVAVSSPQGRFAESAAAVDGMTLRRADAWGKHLFLHLDDEQVVHVHLGLYGKFAVHPDLAGPDDVAPPVGQVRMRLVRTDPVTGETAYADLRGATACELLTGPQVGAITDRLGPDPLRDPDDPGFDPERAWQRIRRSRAPIAGLLMDQSVVAGIGNVYRAELLFRHRTDPFREGRTLRVSRFTAMWEDLVVLMHDGVATGRIDTMRPEDRAAARERRREVSALRGGRRVPSAAHYVYRHDGEPCLLCGATVRTQELQARNLFWCPRCQPRFRSRAVG